MAICAIPCAEHNKLSYPAILSCDWKVRHVPKNIVKRKCHKDHCHPGYDRRPHRLGGVPGISEGSPADHHAYHRQDNLSCHVLFHSEGYHYTRDINKYTVRLFGFAVISHFAYIFASMDFVDWKSFLPFYYGNPLNQTSVMWSLAWGLVMLRVAMSEKIRSQAVQVLLIILICIISFPSDWSCIAALCIMAFGTNRGKFKTQMLWMIFYVAIYAAVYFFAIDKVYGLMQMAVVFSIPILKLYNGKLGRNPLVNKCMKWFFYIYYPLHLFIIGLIS